MGNQTTLVLTTPFGVRSDEAALREALKSLGFSSADDFGHVWVIDALKLRSRGGLHGLRDLVLALPWVPAHGVETHLEVLWADDYTTDDDSWGGRVTPYAYNRETWVIPPRQGGR